MQNGAPIARPRLRQGPHPASPKQGARRRHVRSRPQLLDRSQLDGRTNAAKIFDRWVDRIETDLGGRDHLSSIEHALKEAFVGAYVILNNLNTRLLLGQQIDFSEHAQAVSAMVKVASRLGVKRIARDVTVPTLNQYLAQRRSDDDVVVGEAAE
jgi:hypothetical protein